MHEDTHSDHKSSTLTVFKTMFPMFTYDSPYFFQHFHILIWDSLVENPVFPVSNYLTRDID